MPVHVSKYSGVAHRAFWVRHWARSADVVILCVPLNSYMTDLNELLDQYRAGTAGHTPWVTLIVGWTTTGRELRKQSQLDALAFAQSHGMLYTEMSLDNRNSISWFFSVAMWAALAKATLDSFRDG